LQHLLQTLSSKLELYERLAIFEYEASLERHASAATAFRELAVTERRSCEDLVRHLRLHLDETVDVEQASAPRPAPGQPTMPEEGSRG
jgi:hypothetical protein